MLHAACLELPCNVTRLLRTLDPAGHTAAVKPRLVPGGATAVVRIKLTRPAPLETAAEVPALGRFVLRYGGRTVATGAVLKVKR
jgi:translation elongation factor EF-1alpha